MSKEIEKIEDDIDYKIQSIIAYYYEADGDDLYECASEINKVCKQEAYREVNLAIKRNTMGGSGRVDIGNLLIEIKSLQERSKK